jgi:hypothetical protein
MKKVVIVFVSILMSTISFSQGVSIQVNPDGTHSVIHNSNGNIAIQVNPDGTHSVIHNNNGNVAIKVNPDGTHSVIHNNNGNVAIQVNPDGSHTVIHKIHNTTNTDKEMPKVNSNGKKKYSPLNVFLTMDSSAIKQEKLYKTKQKFKRS